MDHRRYDAKSNKFNDKGRNTDWFLWMVAGFAYGFMAGLILMRHILGH